MEQQIESRQRNDCKNNIGEVVPCYKSFPEKVDQSRIKPVFKRPNNPLFYSISQDDKALPSIEEIEKGCQSLKEGPFKDYIDSFRKLADFWDRYDYYSWKMFKHASEASEEDLIFRKLTGIDEFFDRDLDFNAENLDSIVADLKEICANPSAEDAGTKFLNISAELGNLQVPEVETDEKVQNYTETVCGWEKSQHIPDLEDVSGGSIAEIPKMLGFIRDIQENSKDWKCANRVTKYLNGSIDLINKKKEIFPLIS
jgi:hypothetical protein